MAKDRSPILAVPPNPVATTASVDAAVDAAVAALAYSMSPQNTGLTFLGQPVYQITVGFSAGPGAGSIVNIGHGAGVTSVLSVEAVFTDGSDHVAAPTPGDIGAGGSHGDLCIYIDASKVFVASRDGDYSAFAGLVTFRFV